MPTVASQRDDRRDDPPVESVGEGADGHETIVLTARDWEAFQAAWDSNRPRPRLEAAVRRYRSRRQPDAG